LPPKTGSYCKAVVAADILDDVFKAVLTGLKVTAHPLSTCSWNWQYTCMRPEHNWAVAVVVIKHAADGEPWLHQRVADKAHCHFCLFICMSVSPSVRRYDGSVHDNNNHDVTQQLESDCIDCSYKCTAKPNGWAPRAVVGTKQWCTLRHLRCLAGAIAMEHWALCGLDKSARDVQPSV